MAATPSTPVDLSLAFVLTPPPLGNWLVILPPVLMITLGAVLMMMRHATRLHGLVAVPGLAALVVLDALLLWKVAVEGPITMVMGRWLPPFGIAFTVDVFGALLALVSAMAALAAGIAALSDISETGRRYGFFPFLMLLMAGVSGAFLTGDLFNLYVWFEVLLISSFGLLILGSEREQIDGALKYAVLNLLGTTFFLIAVGYTYAIFGTLNMADLAVRAREMSGAPLMTLAGLFLLAFAMKAAAFPVNFWLPASYHTPRITVSALFGGLLTKVGIYALMRVMIMLFPVQHEAWSFVIGVVAFLTMVLASLGMLAQNDLRQLAGYAVILGIGNMLAGIATGTVSGLAGAVLYALHSILAMTALYLAVGRAAALSGQFTLSSLGGLYQRAPGFAFVSLALMLAVAGLPPFSGLWPKIMLVKASIDIGAWWLAAGILVSGFLSTVALGRVFLIAYWRPAPAQAEGKMPAAAAGPDRPGGSAGWLSFGPLVGLTVIITLFGLFPEAPMSLSQTAAIGLMEPAAYIGSVFPAGGRP
ncbi:Na+/H+ antiporter subunit D [Rhizobium sp. SGZ-381]|uniref:Na+/H+ antiporter subunit D n=1 Tax=Rhizobium sp. SGZ-381 TaxID=3342800 RepID=UPI00366E3B97